MEREKNINKTELFQDKLENLISHSEYLQRAKKFAEDAHIGQKRNSGEPYITHCIEVARIVYEEMKISDEKILASALLHDSVEDTGANPETIERLFGIETSILVDGVTKLDSITGVLNKEQAKKETERKVVDKGFENPVVIVLKLADRLHNMRTLEYMPAEKQIAKSQETLYIYAKLAESLGMWKVMRELEDLSYKYVYPEKYKELSAKRDNDPRTGPEFTEYLKSTLKAIAQEINIDPVIETNINSLPKIEKKLGNYPINKINDLNSFRVIVRSQTRSQARDDVGKMFMAVESYFAHIEDPERLDNFYSKPKKNGYSTLQLTLDFPQGSTEVAITSEEKEEFNNWGVVSLIRKGEIDLKAYALKYVFTPTGTIKFFPRDATGVDYAYSVNPEMGIRAKKIKINGVSHTITNVLPNGSDIEIESSELSNDPRAAKDLLPFANLATTRQSINKQLIEQEKINIKKIGKEQIYKLTSGEGIIDLEDLLQVKEYKPILNNILLMLGCDSLDNLYYKIGANIISPKIMEEQMDNAGLTKKNMGITSILISGEDNPGISAYLTSEIAKNDGNIRFSVSQSNIDSGKYTFSARFLIEGLTKDGENNLRKSFNKDKNFQVVEIV